MAEVYETFHQENLVTLLAHSDEHGKLVAQLADPNMFEGDYRIIAERVMHYWRRQGEAPKMHTPDLFSDILNDPHNRRSNTFRRILQGMLQLNEGINAKYVMDELTHVARVHQLKEAVFRSAEILSKPGDAATIEQTENILSDILKARVFHFDKGRSLRDIKPFVDFVQHHASEFRTGIPELDRNGITPQRGTVFMMIGGKGRGKTWKLVNLGKRALMQGKKVFHGSCENSEDETQMRYYQALFSIPKRHAEKIEVAVFDHKTERSGRKSLSGWHHEEVPLDFSFDDKELAGRLTERVTKLTRHMADNLVIKRFPNRTLTPNGLRGYLDGLELSHGFVPDIVLLDYVKLMKIDMRNPRMSMSDNMEQFRAVMVERNMAGATVDQLTRQGYERRQAGSTHIAEDWASVFTSDFVLTHSATNTEMNHGLARLYVDHARTEKDKFGLLISQCYDIGQFVLDSTRLPPYYFDELMSGLDDNYGFYDDADQSTEDE